MSGRKPGSSTTSVWRNVTDRLFRGGLGPALSLTLLVAAVFWPAFGYDFVRWDDPVNVTHNPLITEPWSWELVAKLLNGDTALRFKPLPWLLYRGIHAGFGFNPAAWHGVSLLLHLGAVLLFRPVLKRLLLRLRSGLPEGTAGALAWAGAAMWAVHPAHVESACWVTATPYPLMVIFLLGSFWCYLRASEAADAAAARRGFVWAWLLAGASYLTYPVGATYGLWLMAADIWVFRMAPSWRSPGLAIGRWLGRHALFLMPALVSVYITWKSSSTTPWLYPAPPTLAEVDFFVRLKMGAAMLGSVWTDLLWPFGQTPNNPMLPAWRVHSPMILTLASLVVLGHAAVWLGRRRWPATTGVVLGSTALALPVLGLAQWPHWAVADRHVYLPHLLLIGAFVLLLVPRAQPAAVNRLRVPALLVLVGALAWLGGRQVRIWQDTDTLFAYLEQQPAFAWNPGQQAYIYQLWAAHAQEQGRSDEARARFQQARHTLQEGALQAAARGALGEAVDLSRMLEQAFGLPPLLRRERARWLLALNRLNEAGDDLQKTLQAWPEDADTQALIQEWQQRRRPASANHL